MFCYKIWRRRWSTKCRRRVLMTSFSSRWNNGEMLPFLRELRQPPGVTWWWTKSQYSGTNAAAAAAVRLTLLGSQYGLSRWRPAGRSTATEHWRSVAQYSTTTTSRSRTRWSGKHFTPYRIRRIGQAQLESTISYEKKLLCLCYRRSVDRSLQRAASLRHPCLWKIWTCRYSICCEVALCFSQTGVCGGNFEGL